MRSEWTDPGTFASVYQIMTYDNVLALRIALETGLRIDDVLSLRRGALQGNVLSFIAKKTGKAGKKKLSHDLVERLNENGGESEWMFPGREGGHRTRQAVWKNLKKAARKLGIKSNLTPHSARKVYAVEMRDEKGLDAVKRELQHDSMNTTMLYAFSDILAKNKATGNGGFDVKSAEALADMIADKVAAKLGVFNKT